MAECQSSGVEGLTRCGRGDPVGGTPIRARDPPASPAAIHRVPHDGVTHVLQMKPNLMGSAGVQLQAQQLDRIKTGNHPGIGPSRTTSGRHGHPLSVLWVSGNRRLDGEWTGIEVAPRQGRVGAAYPAGGNRRSEAPVRQIRLGHDHETRCIPIEAVNDARPPFGSSSQGGTSCYQRIDQSIVPVSWSGVHHQPGGFVDDREVLVLVDQDEGNGTGLKRSGRLARGKLNEDSLAAGEQSRSPGGLTVDADALVGNQASGLSSGEPELIGQKPVEALGMVGENCKVNLLG
jgi:hypothetical protein